MLTAIIVGVVTLIVAIVVVVVVFGLRSKTKSDNISVKKEVHSISSVGTFSSLGNAGHHDSAHPSAAAQRPNVNPSDALKSRFVAMGVLAAAIFGSLTAKLWSMQILSSETYRKQADENQYATVYTPAPRGLIYDADGVELVRNRSSLTVLADGEVADDHDVLQRLSTVLGVPYNVVRQRVQDTSAGAQSQRVVASDARLRDIAFIAEHSDAFSNVTVQTRTVRDYPYGALAAHVLGYAGTVTEEELASVPEGREIKLGDDVGKVGIERYYDNILAGDHGQRKVVADADGNVVEVVSETQPTKGSDVYLTLKAPVQYTCDRLLAELVAPNGSIGSGKGVGAAAVVMDVRDGSIVAMGSYPTFSPGKFIGGISQETWDLYSSEEAHDPLLNRVIAGSFPAASTFKAFTGLAALEYGFADTTRTWYCSGSWDGWNTGSPQHCWLLSGHGDTSFRQGIVVSCDTVFYEIAKNFWENGASQGGALSDTALQDYVKMYGFGSTTGIDLADNETAGRIPTPEWKAEWFRNQPEQAQWQGGDMTNMSIGQGYVLVTPLQMAAAYGAIATGNLMQPHVLKEVRNAEGEVVRSFEPVVKSVPDVPKENLDIMRDALRGVATEDAACSALFTKFGVEAACKTGTAEYSDDEDTAWFACYGPYDDPRYVVACVVEHGGGGGAVAGPVGAELLAAALSYDEGSLKDIGTIAGSSGKSEAVQTTTITARTD